MKHFSFTILLFSLFLLTGAKISSQVVINSLNSGYAGAACTVSMLKDPISLAEYPLARGKFSENGALSITADIKEPATLLIRAGAFRFTVFATPGTSYTLELPEYIPRPAGDEENPFYEEVNYIPGIINLPEDRNNLVREFETEYNNAYNAVAYRVFNNFRRDQLPAILEKLNSSAEASSDRWFSDFVSYRMIMLNLVARGESQGHIEDSVMINRNFNYSNGAYTDLLNQKYSGIFSTLATGRAAAEWSAALTSVSPVKLREILGKYAGISNPEVADYTILLNLYPAFYSGSAPKDLVLALFHRLSSEGSSEYLRQTASDLFSRMELCMPGAEFPFRMFRNNRGDTLSALNDGRPVLIAFVNPANRIVAEELDFLERIFIPYQGRVRLVFIVLDADFLKYERVLLQRFSGSEVFDGGTDGKTRYTFGIKMLPSFFLLGKDNTVFLCQAPMPSENLGSVIGSLLKN